MIIVGVPGVYDHKCRLSWQLFFKVFVGGVEALGYLKIFMNENAENTGLSPWTCHLGFRELRVNGC